MNQPVLVVDRLTKDYGGYRAVDAISFSIERGQVLGLLGANGAGKSTTIQMLLGITTSTAGTISYFGQEFTPRHRQHCLQRINFTSAYNTLQGRISVLENLIVFAGLYNVRRPRRKIDSLLEYFDIGRLANQRYYDLSAGERTRVNIAKALLNDPELILMDEPTASLDPDIADKTLSLIEELKRDRNLSILFTSHNMSEVERICEKVVFLERGKILRQGTPNSLTAELSDVDVVVQFGAERASVENVVFNTGWDYEFVGESRLRIRTSNSQTASVIAELHRAGLELSDVEVDKPTLERVFLDVARGARS